LIYLNQVNSAAAATDTAAVVVNVLAFFYATVEGVFP